MGGTIGIEAADESAAFFERSIFLQGIFIVRGLGSMLPHADKPTCPDVVSAMFALALPSAPTVLQLLFYAAGNDACFSVVGRSPQTHAGG